MAVTVIDALVSEIEKFLKPLESVLDDPLTTDLFLGEIGVNAASAGGGALVTALTDIVALGNVISNEASQQGAPSIADISALFEASKNAFHALQALGESGSPAADIEGFGLDLLDLLIAVYLSSWHPIARQVAILLTLIEPAEAEASSPGIVKDSEVLRMPFRIDRVQLDRLPALIKDPVGTLRAYYWNDLKTEADADAIGDKLFVRVRDLLRELNVDSRYGINPQDAVLFGQESVLIDHALLVYASNQLAGADVDAGVSLTLSPAEHGDLGLVVSPFGVLSASANFDLWQIAFQLAADVQAFAMGRNGPTLLASAGTVELDAKITATLAAPDTGPAFVYGSATGSRIEVGGALLSVEVKLSESKQGGGISASVSKSAIIISPGDGDGFLQSVLPAKGLRADFNLGIAWSDTGGLTFTGAAGLDATLSVGISLGGVVTIPTIHLGLTAGDVGLLIVTSASLGFSIGVIKALIDRLGLTTNLTFPKEGGNLGAANLAFSFKLPSGVGLSIDAGGVTGGGLLEVGPAAHEYSGVLQLEFNDLSLQAFGLITTQVAGGIGYSLLALIDADFPPVQLGWGFTLDGVGGLFAMHRTADTDKLRAALKADKLATILFPKSAISNAPLVLAQLDALFPTAQGRFLFGPMALIGWGTPTVLTVALAVILELPEPIRIVLLAKLAVRLPSPPAPPLVKINMDALGVLDLSQGQLALDATLYDSKITNFALSGDMALRANWGTQREFLLAIGGFHPQFTPPTGFPSLQRVTVDMSSHSIGKLRLAAYLAITSNTLQFGADLDVFIGVSSFGLMGHLAFDTMLQYVPLHFDADISASIALMAGSDTLMSVGLDATLSGPGPWHIAGKFKIHFFFFDLHLSFSATWGGDGSAVPIQPVNVLSMLTTALADSRNWGTTLPDSVPALVSLRSQDGTTVIAHPMAQLEVRERVVPLDLQITRFGTAPISGASKFSITSFTIGTWSGAGTPLQDDFAPAQFFDLTDEEKLSGPSFEQHDAGMSIGTLPLKTATPVLVKTITYETSYLDQVGGALREDSGQKQSVAVPSNLNALLLFSAAGRAAIRNTSIGRYKNQGAGKRVTVKPQVFTIAHTSTLASAGLVSAGGVTYSAAKAAMATMVTKQPGNSEQLQIVALHEMMAP